MNRSSPRNLFFVAGLVGLMGGYPSLAAIEQPTEIGKLGLWLSADELAKSSLVDGQRVISWPDKSGHEFDALYERRVPESDLVTGLHQPPLFEARAPGGFPAVSFDAKDHQTLVLNLAGRALGQKVAGFTAAFFIRPSLTYDPATKAVPGWPEGRVLFITHLSNLNLRYSVQLIEDTGEVRVCSRARPGLPRDTLSSFADGQRMALDGLGWHRLILSVDYSTGEACIFIDGKILRHRWAVQEAGVAENLPSAVTGIGSNTLGAWATFQLAEMMCYQEALTDDQMKALDAYFCAKYQVSNTGRAVSSNDRRAAGSDKPNSTDPESTLPAKTS